jgi:hypothetical protein
VSPAARGRVEALIRLAVLLVLLAPVMPSRREMWWLAMRVCQQTARGFGMCAIAAEQRYRQEIS